MFITMLLYKHYTATDSFQIVIIIILQLFTLTHHICWNAGEALGVLNFV